MLICQPLFFRFNFLHTFLPSRFIMDKEEVTNEVAVILSQLISVVSQEETD
jgi:hypothetical protein